MADILEQLNLPSSFPLDVKTVTSDRTSIRPFQVYRGLQTYDTSTPAGIYVYEGADRTNVPASWTLLAGALTDLETGNLISWDSDATLAEATTNPVPGRVYLVDRPVTSDTVPITSGGTGADNAADARTNLGVDTLTDEQTARLDAIVAEDATAASTNLTAIFPTMTGNINVPPTAAGEITLYGTDGTFTAYNANTRWEDVTQPIGVLIVDTNSFDGLPIGELILIRRDRDNYVLGSLRVVSTEVSGVDFLQLALDKISTRGTMGASGLSIYRSATNNTLEGWENLVNGDLENELEVLKSGEFDSLEMNNGGLTFSDETVQSTAADNVPDGTAIPINSDEDMLTVGNSVYLRSGVIETDLTVYPDATVNRDYVFETNIVSLVDGGHLSGAGSFPSTAVIGNTGERIYTLYQGGAANQPNSIGVFNASTPNVFTPLSAFSNSSFSSLAVLLSVIVAGTDRITISNDELNLLYFKDSTNILYNLTMTTAGDLSTLALGSQFDLDGISNQRYTDSLSWNLDGTRILTGGIASNQGAISFQPQLSIAYDLTTLTQSNTVSQILIPPVIGHTVLGLSFTSTGLIVALLQFTDSISLYIQISGSTYNRFPLQELGTGFSNNFSLSGDYLYVKGEVSSNFYQQYLIQDFVGLKVEADNPEVNETYYIKVQ